MLPTTIITGFLGSGKTTLLNRLLKHPVSGSSLVVVNEFGEIGIDDLTISVPAANVRLLANGCMCCQTRGELVETLAEIAQKRATGQLPFFERVMIETTGLADPVPIIYAIVNDEFLRRAYFLHRVIALIDALHLHGQLSGHPEARKQVAAADILLLSKTDLVDPAELPALETTLAQLNPGAEVFRATYGAVDPQRILGDSLATPDAIGRWLERVAQVDDRRSAGSHTEGVKTFSAVLDAPVSDAGLATWLSMMASLKGPQLLRVKGLVNVDGAPFVIDIVQSVVHQPFSLETWPTADRRSRIVFIVREAAREAVEGTFAAFALGDTLPRTGRFDPDAYGRFRRVADDFIDLKDVTSRR